MRSIEDFAATRVSLTNLGYANVDLVLLAPSTRPTAPDTAYQADHWYWGAQGYIAGRCYAAIFSTPHEPAPVEFDIAVMRGMARP